MLLNVLLDLAIILILAVGVYYGYTRGLFRLICRPIRYIFCLVASFSLCRVAGEYIVSPIIEIPITNYLRETVFGKHLINNNGDVISELPTVIKIAAAIFDVSIDGGNPPDTGSVGELVALLADPFVSIIATVVAFFAIYIFCALACKLVLNIADGILSFGVIGELNRFLGILFSCILSFSFAWIFATFVDFIIHTELLGVDIMQDFRGGPVYSFFVGLSPIRILLSF